MLILFRIPGRAKSNSTIKARLSKLDFFGGFFLIPAVVSLLLALQWGGIEFPWGDSRVWGTLLGFGLLIIVFAGIQTYRKEK